MSATCSKGWGKRCPEAKSVRCKCQCGGLNHGNPKARGEGKDEPRVKLTPSDVLFYRPDDQPCRELLNPCLDGIRFSRDADGRAVVEIRYDGDEVFEPLGERRRLVYHSPDGFEFGYGGSGPADCALNILALFVPPKEATHLHQDFKWAFVSRIDQEKGGSIDAATIQGWILEQWAREDAQDREVAV